VGDDACQWIAELGELRVLNLHGTAISDEGMLLLEGLTKLERLDVGYLHKRLTDRGSRVLLKMPQLKWLNIYASSITDATLAEVLIRLKHLDHVELTSTAVSAEAIERLKAVLPQVQVVRHR